MIDGKPVLVIVPARGGSKGIPLKNLAKVCGETLIAHVGQFVRRLRFVDEAIVSTDHPEIAAEAVKHGLSVPFIRPRSLSGDLIGDFDVLYHALTETERLNDREYHIILMLQPTCPMRTVRDVEQTVGKVVYAGNDSAWTVERVNKKYHPLKQLRVGQEWRLDYYSAKGREIVARQQLEPTHIRNGACYAFTRECLLLQQTIMGKRSAAVVTEPLVNIDTPEDLAEAERLMGSR